MKDFHLKKFQHIKLWAWAASTLPIVTLFSVILFNLLAPQDVYDIVIICVGILLFLISVIWWWWVMYTLAQLTNLLSQTSKDFLDVKNEVIEIRNEIIEEKNVSNRKRREQKNN